MLTVFSVSVWADSTWEHKWDKSRADGGEGFYHISANNDTIQEAKLNGLLWNYQANSSVTAFMAAAGQYLGSATTPVFLRRLMSCRIVWLISMQR